MSNDQKVGIIGIIGGVLMLLSGITGLSTWERAGDVALALTGIEAIGYVFIILMIIGSLGGLAVMAGSWLIMSKMKIRRKNKVKTGKMLITLGAGFGFFGLIIMILVSFLSNSLLLLIAGANLGFIGLVLTIIARKKIR